MATAWISPFGSVNPLRQPIGEEAAPVPVAPLVSEMVLRILEVVVLVQELTPLDIRELPMSGAHPSD